MKRLVWMIPILLGLWALDQRLSDGRTAGHRRGSIARAMARVDAAPDARVLVLGSSTTGELLTPPVVAAALGLPTDAVVSGHINGCHQGCTWAEAKAIAASGRRYARVLVGVNLFQQCEHGHSKRVMQQLTLAPPRDVPGLLALYRHAESPLRSVARAIGMLLSGAYADARVARYRLGLGRAFRPLKDRWFTAGVAPEAPTPGCEYTPEATALKAAFTVALVEALAQLADRTTFVLLPDRGLAAGEPAQIAQLPAFRRLMADLVAPHPTVDLLDLIEGNPATAADFRDGIHLTADAVVDQASFFHKRFAMSRR